VNALTDSARPASTGQATLEVEMVFGESTVTSAYSAAPMKLLTPISRGLSVWAYTSNFGGGLVAGDQTRLGLTLGPETRCYLGTQSSTKVYRNPTGQPCSHTTHADLAAGAILAFIPEPVQAFADSHYTQRQEFHLQTGAGLVLLDWFTSGRAARSERWNFSHLESRNDVFFNGERILADPLRLGSAAVPKQMGRFNCLASLLLLGSPPKAISERLLQEIAVRPAEKNASLSASASPVRDGVLLRVVGESVERVRQEIQAHLYFLRDLLGDDPWSRKW
jgi:urease accessory protein